MSKKLDGRVAIITGSTSGMGAGIARRFAAEGAAVIVNGRNAERGAAMVAEIEAAGGRAHFVAADIASEAGNQALVDAAVESFGGVDILVPNAGILGNGRITDLDATTWHAVIDTNLSSIFYLLKAGIPQLQARGGGSVLVNASIAADMVFPGHPAYCASKAGAVALAKQAALDYGPEIRVNVLAPGQVDTPLLWESTKSFDDPEGIVQQVVDDYLVMKRLGTPEDIAAAALFLVSDDASWVTGTVFTIDGGRLLK